MAEYAEGNLELMREELHTLRSSKLFTESELSDVQKFKTSEENLNYLQTERHRQSSVIKSRRKLEYALLKQKRSISDFLNYIEHEKSLLVLLKKRKKSSKVNEIAYEAEKSIMDRIVRLHRQLCYRFQSSPAHWLAFIEACDAMQRPHTSEIVWRRMLQVHNSTDPQLWSGAAQWVLRIRTPALAKEASKQWTRERINALRAKANQRIEEPEVGEDDSGFRRGNKNKGSRMRIRARDISILKQAAKSAELTPWFHVFTDARDLLLRGVHFHPHSVELHEDLLRLALTEWHFFTQTEKGADVRREASLQSKTLPEDTQLVNECHTSMAKCLQECGHDSAALSRIRTLLQTEFSQFATLHPSTTVEAILNRTNDESVAFSTGSTENEPTKRRSDVNLRHFLQLQLREPLEALKWFESWEREHPLRTEDASLLEAFVRLAIALQDMRKEKILALFAKYQSTFQHCPNLQKVRELVEHSFVA